MKLFISHASEDKRGFVDPLVLRLQTDFEVWYDKSQLTIGDSLLQKINEGLHNCDFGVVVLSPAFFEKRWPKAELDGLFALEQQNRKVILPIWKDVEEEDVKAFSPILAGRLAVRAQDGMDRVVNEIIRAVGLTQRVASFNGLDAARERLKTLDKKSADTKAAQQLANSNEGVVLAERAANDLITTLAANLREMTKDLKEFPLRFEQSRSTVLLVHAPYRLSLILSYSAGYTNTIEYSRLELMLFERDDMGRWREKAENNYLFQKFKPWFDPERSVTWLGDNRSQFSTRQIVEHAISVLIEKLGELHERHPI